MATSKQMYEKPIKGYWENINTGHIYMLFEGHYTDNQKTKERTFWNAGAINLRTGKIRKLRLKDFAMLKSLDTQTTRIIEANIDVPYFYQHCRGFKIDMLLEAGCRRSEYST